jgi:hypothetical protein
VVGEPVVRRLVEALVLDRPAGVAELDDGRRARHGRRERCHPEPFRDEFLRFTVELAGDRADLATANDPDTAVDLWPGGEALEVPALAGFLSQPELAGRADLEERRGVLDQVAPLALQDRQHMLLTREHGVEQPRVRVEGVGQNDIESPRIKIEHSLQEP